jgi:UDP-glucuronate decarboxylase
MIEESNIVKEDIKNIADEIKDISYKLEGETVLLAGGAGGLGKYIISTIDYLNKNSLENPCKLIILDNFITGLKENVLDNEHIKVIQHDISKKFETTDKIDYIIHAASLASPKFYNKYRLETINVGFLGTENLLELAKEKNVKSFLFFSSSEVYGDPTPEFIPTPEDYRGNVACDGPRACYDEAKRVGEALCFNYESLFNIPTKVVRPFNVYGPGMRLDDGRVIPNFITSAINGEKIPIYGDGTQTRTFCYNTDATVGWFKALLSEEGRTFNIGNDRPEIQMGFLAEIVTGLVGNPDSTVEYVKDKLGVYGNKSDPNRRCPDLTRSRNLLNYNPKTSLVTGLKRFITWTGEQLELQKASNLEKKL